VDFRELVKDLAGVFRARIELRQIGVRDEAKMVGGLGICGRPFCCSQYMDDFMPVSIKMAKTQNLSLNPTKISGTCGRLMCCLKYEQNAYEDALKRLPKNDSFVLTPDGTGNVTDVNVLKETVMVRLDDQSDAPRRYHGCELCILRNGKGSRDGIVVPRERPERFVEEPKEEEFPLPMLISDFGGEEPAERREKSGSKRRRSRGHRGGHKSAEGGQTRDVKQEPAKSGRGEEKSGEGKSRSARRRHSRGGETRPTAVQAVAVEKSGEGGQAAAPRKRPRHRGGRRHNRGGASAAPKKED
jgi:hypothetical protein